MAVSPFLPDTMQDAIDRAKAYEMTYSRGGNLSAYSAQQVVPSIPGMNTGGGDQALEALVKQLAGLMMGNKNSQQDQRPRIQNNANNGSRPPVKCFHCNQPGL